MKPLLDRLEKQDLEMLYANSKIFKYQKDEYIFREGDVADKLFLIQKGSIRIYKKMKTNKEVTVFLRKSQDAIGEIGIFSGETYSNSAEATEPTEVYAIEKKDMENIMSQNGRLGLEITRWMAESLEASKAKLRDYLVFGSEGAVASVFIRLTNMYGVERAEGVQISHPVMIQDIAKYIGVSRETVSRIISKWKSQGIIDNDVKYFIVKDISFFREMLMCNNCGVQNCVL